MVVTAKIQGIADSLWKEPNERNWGAFAKALRGSGIVYYRVVFGKGKLKSMQDLMKSYAELYDSKFKLVTKIPVFQRTGKRVRGATKYMIGLKVSNLVD